MGEEGGRFHYYLIGYKGEKGGEGKRREGKGKKRKRSFINSNIVKCSVVILIFNGFEINQTTEYIYDSFLI